MYLFRSLKTGLLAGFSVLVLGWAAFLQPLEAPAQQQRPRRSWTWVDPDRDVPGMQYETFYSRRVHSPVSYLVYLPLDYPTVRLKRYPVIYWLHGLNGRQRRAAVLARRLGNAERKGFSGAIVIGVNGLRAGMYTDSKDGEWPVESVIVNELVPHVDSAYRTIARREARAIEGMSMGGFGAFYLGFKYPDRFGVVSSYAPALHNEDSIAERRPAIFEQVYGGDKAFARSHMPWQVVKRNAGRIRGRTVIRQIIGAEDRLYGWNRQFHALLEGLGIEHAFHVIPEAGHNYRELERKLADRTVSFYEKAFFAANE